MIAASILPVQATPLLVVDRSNLSVLYAQDAGQPWHPASLTKLMTAYVVFEELALGTITLDTPVRISKGAVALAPSKSGLAVDSSVTMRDALYLLIVRSANDVAYAIAETIAGTEANFAVKMNDVARRMGMTGTNFVNSHGLHVVGQVSTARDLAILSLYIEQAYPQYMPIFQTGTVRLNKAVYEANNALLKGFSGTNGMKTGYTCAAGLNVVATVDRNGRRLLAVVLGGSSARERNERAAELFTNALSGRYQGSGQSLLSLVNSGGAAQDMRPLVCGAGAPEYIKAREAEFPMGLKGQPSYLNDEIPLREYTVVDLGRTRSVAFPRPRPAHVSRFAAPAVAATSTAPIVAERAVSLPIPRPADL
ncbi:D-alanyl-D-alanine carboxypeptidase family protein [Devosia sp. MC1541]|uniref:D-alanyl-D-alanine carboxypeptidase family protein n=1 Tax=Devosia sp. MC1541 TaxID=2725264 RepID=UPI00145F6467|nr:D-alanyl-D-alanine carboxypeptidase family protein [Devosia sp. MC1541]